MKNIVSTTGESISFQLNKNRLIVIESVVGVQVSDAEFAILDARLGNQIKVLTAEVAEVEPTVEVQVSEEVAPIETPDVITTESEPVVVTELEPEVQ